MIQTAAKRGKYAVGYQSDMAVFAPDLNLTSAVYQWAPIYHAIAEQLHNGKCRSDNIWWGMEENAIGLTSMSKSVPKEVADLVETQKQRITEGSLRVFEGPIRDADGNVLVQGRTVMTDADLLSMDYFVRGVSGVMPAGADAPSDAEVN